MGTLLNLFARYIPSRRGLLGSGHNSIYARAASIYFLLESPPIFRSLSLHVDPRSQTLGAGCGSSGRRGASKIFCVRKPLLIHFTLAFVQQTVATTVRTNEQYLINAPQPVSSSIRALSDSQVQLQALELVQAVASEIRKPASSHPLHLCFCRANSSY